MSAPGDAVVPAGAALAPIDLAVIGGYLGAGKTTVVNAILQAPHGGASRCSSTISAR